MLREQPRSEAFYPLRLEDERVRSQRSKVPISPNTFLEMTQGIHMVIMTISQYCLIEKNDKGTTFWTRICLNCNFVDEYNQVVVIQVESVNMERRVVATAHIRTDAFARRTALLCGPAPKGSDLAFRSIWRKHQQAPAEVTGRFVSSLIQFLLNRERCILPTRPLPICQHSSLDSV